MSIIDVLEGWRNNDSAIHTVYAFLHEYDGFRASIENSDTTTCLFILNNLKTCLVRLCRKAFKAIDQQMQIGADVREVVGQVLEK